MAGKGRAGKRELTAAERAHGAGVESGAGSGPPSRPSRAAPAGAASPDPPASHPLPTSARRGSFWRRLPHPRPRRRRTPPGRVQAVRVGTEARALPPPGRRARDGGEPVAAGASDGVRAAPVRSSSAAGLLGEPGRGLARGIVGKAWRTAPGRPRRGAGGWGGRWQFRLTWRLARNPGPAPVPTGSRGKPEPLSQRPRTPSLALPREPDGD